ncbi:MAG: helix-turn-helix transcriptional regulator [Burkholderiales bacterium]
MKAKKPAPQSARIRLAANLRAARKKQQISQEELADRAEIDRSFVGSVERCERNISLDNIERLSVALGMDVADLLKKA